MSEYKIGDKVTISAAGRMAFTGEIAQIETPSWLDITRYQMGDDESLITVRSGNDTRKVGSASSALKPAI